VTRAVLTAACLFLLGTGTAFADDTLWTRRYDGQGRRNDYAQTVLVDQEDNIIVVGTCMGTSSGNDVGVVKYSYDGTQLWFGTIAGPGASDEEARGAALDPDGNIYITASTGLYPDYDILTVKLGPWGGGESWRRTYAGTAGRADVPTGIVVDSAGNAYVTGYTIAAGDSSGWVTMKHSTGNGLRLWTVNRVGGLPAAIALGPDNAVYVTGYSAPRYMDDYCTVKYSTTGVEQWASFYDHSDNGPDIAAAIAVDDEGDAYVTGTSATAPPPGGINQYATVKYADDAGTQMWVARYSGEGGNNTPAALALGDSAVYVTGSSQGPAGDDDYATVAYDKSSGSQLWATRFDGPAGKNDNAVDLAALPSGKILVTGTSVDANDKGDIATFTYTEAGVVYDSRRYNSPVDNDDIAAAVTFDSHSVPIVTGSSFMSGYYDFLTVKYGAPPGSVEFKPVVPARSGMRLAPNPARNWTNVQHSLSGTAPAIISLLGADGRMVRTQRFDGQKGVPSRLDLTGLTSGVYVVRIDAAGQHATLRLVVLR
jgi:hypothetical protein